MAAIQRLRFAFLLLAGVTSLGVSGYVAIEHWSVFDALYMTVVTMSTVGYGEIHNLSLPGRVFTLGLIVVGRLTEAYVVLAFAELVLSEALREKWEQRRMEKQLARMSGHQIVCGWGRMGQEITEEFRRKRVPCVVVDVDAEKCRKLAELGIPYVHGEASSDQVLNAAGVARAAGLITVAPRDADNIFITLSARALNPKLFIVARSSYEEEVHKLEIAGADRVVSPYVIGARRIAAAVFQPTVIDFLDLTVRRNELEWELADIPVPMGSKYAGKSLEVCGFTQGSGCTVLAVRQGAGGPFVANPCPDTLLQPGDTLIVLGSSAALGQLRSSASAPRGTSGA